MGGEVQVRADEVKQCSGVQQPGDGETWENLRVSRQSMAMNAGEVGIWLEGGTEAHFHGYVT